MRLVRPDRHRHDPADERAERAVEPARPALGVDAVLRMQSLVGNHAVSRLLARERALPESAGAKDHVATIAGIGRFTVSAYQLTGKNALTLTFEEGDAAQRLFQAFTRGEPIATVTITASTHVITLTDVLVTNFQHADDRGGPPIATVELTGAALTVK